MQCVFFDFSANRGYNYGEATAVSNSTTVPKVIIRILWKKDRILKENLVFVKIGRGLVESEKKDG